MRWVFGFYECMMMLRILLSMFFFEVSRLKVVMSLGVVFLSFLGVCLSVLRWLGFFGIEVFAVFRLRRWLESEIKEFLFNKGRLILGSFSIVWVLLIFFELGSGVGRYIFGRNFIRVLERSFLVIVFVVLWVESIEEGDDGCGR